MNRGDIRWYTFRNPDKRRPVLVLTRDSALDNLQTVPERNVGNRITGLGLERMREVDQALSFALDLHAG